MAAFANVQVMGWMSKDAQFDVTQTGISRCRITIPVNARRSNGAGQEGFTAWYQITLFGAQAETAQKLAQMGALKKGTQLIANGRFEPREWVDANGVIRLSFDLIADFFQLTGAEAQPARAMPVAEVNVDDEPAPAPAKAKKATVRVPSPADAIV